MKKKTITLLMVSVLSLHTMAQNVSNSEAFDIAQSFMAKKGITLVKKNTTRLDESYVVFDGEDCIGYTVVMNGRVVAYSTKESSDEFTLMCSKTRSFELTPKYPIAPMVDCMNYSQGFSPFNDMTPILENTKGEMVHCPVGCGPIAVAKIMFYYKNPKCEAIPSQYIGNGYPTLEALPETTFNWDLIRQNYKNGYTSDEGYEVAKLMKYVGYVFQTRYLPYSAASWLKLDRFKLLGFSDDTYSTLNDHWNSLMGTWEWFNAFDEWKLSDKQLENVLDDALEKGRPVLMAGYDRDAVGGHWYVIDGRDDTGMYHVQGSGYYIISQEMYMNRETNRNLLGLLNKVWLVVPVMPKGYTSIEATKIDKTSDKVVYNLQGQKVGDSIEGLSKGLYIKNGKKQVVK